MAGKTPTPEQIEQMKDQIRQQYSYDQMSPEKQAAFDKSLDAAAQARFGQANSSSASEDETKGQRQRDLPGERMGAPEDKGKGGGKGEESKEETGAKEDVQNAPSPGGTQNDHGAPGEEEGNDGNSRDDDDGMEL